MSAIANIAAYDGTSGVQILHTFVPVSVSREGPNKVRSQWRETGLAVPTIAQPRLDMVLEKLKSGIYRLERRLVIPVMESISGQNSAGYTAAPKVAYENTDIYIGFFSERSDVAGRRLIRQLGVNIDGNVGTAVAPATTGPLPELFDLLVSQT